jgi:hypothetical protein|tara:strand:- start:295 stop:519 length:225 start_codon:yes stop_codon:yes gene_type:complete
MQNDYQKGYCSACDEYEVERSNYRIPKKYLKEALDSFDADPPDNEFQRGYCSALNDMSTYGLALTRASFTSFNC